MAREREAGGSAGMNDMRAMAGWRAPEMGKQADRILRTTAGESWRRGESVRGNDMRATAGWRAHGRKARQADRLAGMDVMQATAGPRTW